MYANKKSLNTSALVDFETFKQASSPYKAANEVMRITHFLEEKQMCFVAGRDFATLSAISPPLSLSL
jgi:hypothetical protein